MTDHLKRIMAQLRAHPAEPPPNEKVVNVWRLITHHADREGALSWTKQHGRIAIGWGTIGDLEEQDFQSADDIKDAIRQAFREGRHTTQNSGNGGPSLWDFWRTMQPGDLVILTGSRPREVVAQVEGPYEWRQDVPLPEVYKHYNYQRRVRITRLDPEAVWRAGGGGYVPGASVYRTLIRLARPIGENDL